MASAASSSWLSQTERRLQGWRKKDIEGSGFARWREASKIISDRADDGPSLERSQIVLNEVRKDLGSTKLQFDPHRCTFVVEGRPVQVHVSYRLLQGSGGTLLASRSPSPALLGSLSRRSPLLELKGDIGDPFLEQQPLAFPRAHSVLGCSGFGAHPRGRDLDGAAPIYGRAVRPCPGRGVFRSRGEADTALPARRVRLQLVEGLVLSALETFTTKPSHNFAC